MAGGESLEVNIANFPAIFTSTIEEWPKFGGVVSFLRPIELEVV